jgi:hypothetical protein
MKITTKTTTTETKEIEINFPCFTKVVGFSTAFYCIKSENEVFRVEQYDGTQISTFSNYSNISESFKEGFEFIEKSTFFKNYDEIVSKLYDNMEELQASLVEDDRTDFEIEQERKEAEERAELEDYRMQNELED